MTVKNTRLPTAVQNFDERAGTGLVSISDACVIAARSRASIYRDNKAGLLPFVKVGGSSRIRISDLRRFIGVQ